MNILGILNLLVQGNFFNSIEIIKNEATTFDSCCQYLLAFLKKIDIIHLLPENYSELFEEEINKELK